MIKQKIVEPKLPVYIPDNREGEQVSLKTPDTANPAIAEFATIFKRQPSVVDPDSFKAAQSSSEVFEQLLWM